MLRGHVSPLSTTIWFCSEAILPSVKDDSSGEAFHPVVAPVGHQRPLSSELEPHGRWMRSRRCGAVPVSAFARMGRQRAPAAPAASPPRNVRRRKVFADIAVGASA